MGGVPRGAAFKNLDDVLSYTTFAIVLATIADTCALYVLRIREPDRRRPYRAAGYPIVPGLYLVANLGIAISMVINLFNPSTVFVLGKMFDAQDNLFQQLLHLVRQRALAAPLADCRVFRSQANKLQGAVAGIVCHLTSALAPKVN